MMQTGLLGYPLYPTTPEAYPVGTPVAAPAPAVAPTTPPPSIFPASLITTESGGNWNALNNVPGAGGHTGHGGRLQFGTARLADAARAGVIPPMTAQQFAQQPPEVQMAVEQWHFQDIDNFIRQNGLDRAVGTVINGVPVTLDGMRAVAHLGGVGGLQRFIESGGQYNPADANGTSLLDYLGTHGAGGQSNMPQSQPQGLLAPTMSTMSAPQQQQGPQGLLAPLWSRLEGVPVLGRLADEETRTRLAMGLAGLSSRPNQGLIQGMQGRLDEMAQAEKLNQTIVYLESIGRGDLAAAIAAGMSPGDALATALTPATPVQARMSQILEDGTIIQSTDQGPRVFAPSGEELTGNAARDAIAEANRQRVENERAVYEGRRSGTLEAEVDMGRDANRELAAGTVEGQTEAERTAAAPGDIAAAQMALDGIAGVRNHPALQQEGNAIQNFLDGGVGASSWANVRPGSQGYDLNARVEQLKGSAFLDAIAQLRGMGALSNTEGQTATSAITRLSTGLSREAFIKALDDYERVVRLGMERAQRIANGEVVQIPLEAAPPSSDEIQSLLDRYAPVQ